MSCIETSWRNDPFHGYWLRVVVRTVVFAVIALLAACSGGGGDDDEGEDGPSEPPEETGPAVIEGVWVGTAKLSSDGSTKTAVILADKSGDTLLYVANGADTFTVRGDACCDGLVDGNAEGWWLYEKMSGRVPVHLNVTDLAVGGRSITGKVTVENIDYALSLSLVEDFADPLTLTKLAGKYTRTTRSGTTFTYTLSDSGVLTGGEGPGGCQYSGHVTIPDGSHNFFELDRLQLSGCPPQASIRNGNYTGLGHLYDSEGGSDDTLVILATGPVSWVLDLPVKPPAPASLAPAVSLSALTPSVQYGGETMLAWSTHNASTCTAKNGWTGDRAPSGGQQLTGPITASTTFELTCVAASGGPSTTASIVVAVEALPPEIPSGEATATLAGIDNNANGLRDDIERHLLTEHRAGPIRSALLERARDLGRVVSTSLPASEAQQANLKMFENLECMGHFDPDNAGTQAAELLAQFLDTPPRVRAYLAFNESLAGQAIEMRSAEELEAACGSYGTLNEVASIPGASPSIQKRMPRPAAASKLMSSTDPVAVIHVNGVMTDALGLEINAEALERALGSTVAADVPVWVIHNPSEGALLDVFESALQSDIQSSRIIRMLHGLEEWTPEFLDAYLPISNAASATEATTGVVVNSIVSRVQKLQGAHAKVILVPHSQGNFFVNAAHRALSAEQKQCAWVVGAASPDVPTQHATYEYVTLTQDKVIEAAAFFRQKFGKTTAPPTTSSSILNSPSPFNSLGHAFNMAYLISGTASRSELLTYIANARNAPRPGGTPCAIPDDPLPPGVGPRWTFVFAGADAQVLGQTSCSEVLVECSPWYNGLRASDQSAAPSQNLSLMTGNFTANLRYSSSSGFRSMSVNVDGLLRADSRPLTGPDNTPNYYPYGEARGLLTMTWKLNATGHYDDPNRTPITSFIFDMSGESKAEFSTSPTVLPLVESEDSYPGVPLCAEPQIRLTSDSGSTITLGGIFGTDPKTGSISAGQYTVSVTATADQLQLNSGVVDDSSAASPSREITCKLHASFRLSVTPPAP